MTERYLRWYEKYGDELIGEKNIDKISFETLKKIFNPPDYDILMYDCYPVNILQWEQLNTYLDSNFEFDKYAYFIEAEGDE